MSFRLFARPGQPFTQKSTADHLFRVVLLAFKRGQKLPGPLCVLPLPCEFAEAASLIALLLSKFRLGSTHSLLLVPSLFGLFPLSAQLDESRPG